MYFNNDNPSDGFVRALCRFSFFARRRPLFLLDMISKNDIKFVHSLELKKKRREEKAFVAEGPKLVGELIGTFRLRAVYALQQWIEANEASLNGVTVKDATQDELRKISFLETPQEVVAVFEQPDYDVDARKTIAENLCIALDGVQNPGNLGTIVRLADWFGISDVFCSADTADIFNPKTVQATMGGMARVRVHYTSLPELVDSLDNDVPVYGTLLDGSNIYTQDLQQRGLIVMGNEGKGLSEEMRKRVSHKLYIPNYPEGSECAESLNVAIATAVVCAEFRRRG